MRSGGPPKQRVWLGARQCCHGGGESATDPNRCAESCAKCDSVRGWNANTNAHSNSNGYGNSNGHGHGNCHSYAKCNSDTDGHGYLYSISDTYGDTKSHTETSSDSASPAVSV